MKNKFKCLVMLVFLFLSITPTYAQENDKINNYQGVNIGGVITATENINIQPRTYNPISYIKANVKTPIENSEEYRVKYV